MKSLLSWRSVRIFLFLFGWMLLGHWLGFSPASGHHTGRECGPGGRPVCLPLMDRSMALHTMQTTHELTWCVNSRANNYPGFVSQIHQVLDQHASVIGGLRHRQIPGTYETPQQALNAGCQVQHNMPENHGCGGCAAWVHYLNWPVLVEYKWQLGYNSTNGWLTTISHETGHIYGLHEHYDDANFRSHRGSYGYWAHGMFGSPGTSTDSPTVMDFGTGVWQFTEYDARHSCQLLDPFAERFTGCGFQEPDDLPEWSGIIVQYEDGSFGQWNNWTQQWHRTCEAVWSERDPVWRCP